MEESVINTSENTKTYMIEQVVKLDIPRIIGMPVGKEVDCTAANMIVPNHLLHAVTEMIKAHPTAEIDIKMVIDKWSPISPCYRIQVNGRVWNSDE